MHVKSKIQSLSSLRKITIVNKMKIHHNSLNLFNQLIIFAHMICHMRQAYIYSSTRHNTNRKHSINNIPYTNIQHITYFNTARLKILYSTTPLHNKHSHRPPHSHYNKHKTNMRYIHTYIVSLHLATRGNNRILRTPPPHIISSEEILPRITHRTFVQLRTNKSPFLKSYLHKVDTKSHSSPICPVCITLMQNTRHLFNCTHIHTTLDLWTDHAGVIALLARWMEKLAGGPQTRRFDSPPPPLAKGMGLGRQQQTNLQYWLTPFPLSLFSTRDKKMNKADFTKTSLNWLTDPLDLNNQPCSTLVIDGRWIIYLVEQEH